MFKSEKGITLVALVITIIVLLILAGITLMLALGDNGILGQAEDARITQIEAEVRETMQLALLSARTEMMAKIAKGNEDGTPVTITAAEVKTYIENALPQKNGSISGDWQVNVATLGTADSGSIVYKGANYKQATDYADAIITQTYTVSDTGYTLTNGAITYTKAAASST